MSALPTSSSVALSRLRIIHKSFLTRRGGSGRHNIRSSTSMEYRPALQSSIHNNNNNTRVIDAEVLHGDEQKFWGERRSFYCKRLQYFPTWDRLAQTLIIITREVPRVPQEMAFRLMAVFLKLTLLPRVSAGAEVMLPAWLAHNVEGVLTEELKDNKEKDKEKEKEEEKKEK